VTDSLLAGSVAAAFAAGMVAFFAPCCSGVMLPAYLAAIGGGHRLRVARLTAIYIVGVALVVLPVTLGAAVLMAVTTYAMLQTSDPFMAGVLVFLAGIAMAPVFPTTLAMVGDAFPRMTATAMGIVITFGWIGLMVSSPIIGAISESANLGTALLLLPGFSVVMILVNVVMRPLLRQKPQVSQASQ
jgi:MFS family permease